MSLNRRTPPLHAGAGVDGVCAIDSCCDSCCHWEAGSRHPFQGLDAREIVRPGQPEHVDLVLWLLGCVSVADYQQLLLCKVEETERRESERTARLPPAPRPGARATAVVVAAAPRPRPSAPAAARHWTGAGQGRQQVSSKEGPDGRGVEESAISYS